MLTVSNRKMTAVETSDAWFWFYIACIALYVAVFAFIHLYVFPSGPQLTTHRHPNGDNMKMKSAKSLLNKAKRGANQRDVVKVKTEYDSELEGGEEEGSCEVHTNGGGLNIQIKEEPHAQEISEEHNGGSLSCLDTKPDTLACRSDVHHQQGLIKDECDSDHQSEYDFTEAAVKEESESWIKEEGDSKEEEEETDNIQEDYGEGEELCTGRSL